MSLVIGKSNEGSCGIIAQSPGSSLGLDRNWCSRVKCSSLFSFGVVVETS